MIKFSKFFTRTTRETDQSPEYLLFHSAKPARRTFGPEPAPENADKELRDFFKRTEWLQPYFNFTQGRYWSFDEEPGHWVSLGTYDQPDYGRTFEIQYNAALVGTLSVVPDWLGKNEGWVELRLGLHFPIELLPSEQVHGLLTGLASSVFDNIEHETQSGKAEQLATTAMTKAIWDARAIAGSSLVVEMFISGSLGVYQTSVDHWRKGGINAWEKFEPQRDE